MAGMTINFQGLSELITRLKRTPKDLDRELSKTLFLEAEEVMSESKTRVPVDTGALRSTGHVERPSSRAGKIELELGYGGPAAPPHGRSVGYAVFVHENLRARHTVGEAKYLERPLLEAKNRITQSLSQAIRRAMT